MSMVRILSLWIVLLLPGGVGTAFAQRTDAAQPPPLAQNPQEQDAAEEEAEAEPDPPEEPAAQPVRPRAQPAPQRPRPPPTIRRAGPQPPAANAPVRAARPAPPRAIMTAPGSTDGVPPLDELIATRERPLFSSTRRPPPPVEEPDIETPITEAKSMSFELVGVVRSDDSAFAILRNTESKEETRVPKGEKFGAWTIEEVHDRSIVLAGDARRIRMRLFDESKSPGISIRKVGDVDGDPDDASALDDGQVDEDVAPSASPEGRPATAQPVQRRTRGDNNMTPAQRRKARLQQQRRQQQLRNNDE